MAVRRPLVLLGNNLTSELPMGDTLPGIGGGGNSIYRMERFISSGTFTPSPAHLAAGGWVMATVIGGGGGGGGAAAASGATVWSVGGGGGGGGYSVAIMSTSTYFNIIVGAGGAGGLPGSASGAGGESRITAQDSGLFCASYGGGQAESGYPTIATYSGAAGNFLHSAGVAVAGFPVVPIGRFTAVTANNKKSGAGGCSPIDSGRYEQYNDGTGLITVTVAGMPIGPYCAGGCGGIAGSNQNHNSRSGGGGGGGVAAVGNVVANGQNGRVATGSGGGGGASSKVSAGANGGNGGSGIVIIEWMEPL
jgi:hypothetical protein